MVFLPSAFHQHVVNIKLYISPDLLYDHLVHEPLIIKLGQGVTVIPKEDQVPENNEISIHYVHTGEIWDRNKIVVDNIFSYKVALDITRSNDNEYEP